VNINHLTSESRSKISTHTLRSKKIHGEVIAILTAYDYPTALALDQAEIDAILVGDSLGMVVLGYQTTLPVTMEEMLHHCRAVSRGAQCALLIGDMPFMSYQVSVEDAVRNAGRFLQEAGMDAVKLEGGRERCDAVRSIVEAGIPVMGHIGLTPQSVHQLGGFRVQGKTLDSAIQLFEDALRLQEAGCFSLVLESIPDRLAGLISKKIEIPTIGIGAGSNCDGQVLVTHDVLGMYDRISPRFSKRYKNFQAEMEAAFSLFKQEIIEKAFPTENHIFRMPDELWDALINYIES
jgi:3-methyl-2-oxobutanoate hydroxymethyltransferase